MVTTSDWDMLVGNRIGTRIYGSGKPARIPPGLLDGRGGLLVHFS
jgi:hypothetical protein